MILALILFLTSAVVPMWSVDTVQADSVWLVGARDRDDRPVYNGFLWAIVYHANKPRVPTWPYLDWMDAR